MKEDAWIKHHFVCVCVCNPLGDPTKRTDDQNIDLNLTLITGTFLTLKNNILKLVSNQVFCLCKDLLNFKYIIIIFVCAKRHVGS